MEDGARESKVGSLNHLDTPKLKDRVDSEDYLKKGESFNGGVILKDMFTSDGEKGDEIRRIGEEIRAVEGGVCKGSGKVGMLDGSEISESPEVESRIGERGIWECKITRSGMEWVRGGSAHCGARSKRERR